MSTWTDLEADKAFSRARAPRGRVMRWLRRARVACAQLCVFDVQAGGGRAVMREVPLDAIRGTLEPNRAKEFDAGFRPRPLTRSRWLRVWEAEHRGTVLPPISIVRLGDEYAVRDGHHRVSVAKARGALTINALVTG
jgi:hypothetical protein